jgi:hypothetical protein
VGVSGGIIVVVPQKMGIAVFSPPLDSHGSSVRGMKVCEDLSERFGLHLLICRWIATNLLIDSLIKNWLTWIVGVNPKTRLLTPICPLMDNFLSGVYLAIAYCFAEKSTVAIAHIHYHISVRTYATVTSDGVTVPR